MTDICNPSVSPNISGAEFLIDSEASTISPALGCIAGRGTVSPSAPVPVTKHNPAWSPRRTLPSFRFLKCWVVVLQKKHGTSPSFSQ